MISVFSKEGLEPIIRELDRLGVKIYSTGGTQTFIEQRGIAVEAVENITSYPSILDGRVKTLHPKVFGGLLARREAAHLAQLEEYDIPEIDLVIVDLYPFEETLAQTQEEAQIIEKIDIGGISLIRAAAKNYRDVVVVPSRAAYGQILDLLREKEGHTDLADRKDLARRAFAVSSHYDTAIFGYFNAEATDERSFKHSIHQSKVLRYGENPHQEGVFFGDFSALFDQLNGKAISYNTLDAIDAAVDAKDWALARSLFADEITVDFTSLVGGEPATIPADALIAGWSGNLTEEKQSFQLRGNHRVVWDSPDHARMHSHGYAWNRMEAGALPENGGDPMWEVWGTYTHDFERESDGWVVTGMAFVMMAERGNLWVRNTPGE